MLSALTCLFLEKRIIKATLWGADCSYLLENYMVVNVFLGSATRLITLRRIRHGSLGAENFFLQITELIIYNP